MNYMIEATNKLRQQVTLAAYLKKSIILAKTRQENIEVALTPAEGWPGKNEGEHKLAQIRTYNDHCPWLQEQAEILSMQMQSIEVDAEIECLKAELDLRRWMIRNEANVCLGGVDVLQDEATFAGISQEMDSLEKEPQEPEPEMMLEGAIELEPFPDPALAVDPNEPDCVIGLDDIPMDDLPFQINSVCPDPDPEDCF